MSFSLFWASRNSICEMIRLATWSSTSWPEEHDPLPQQLAVDVEGAVAPLPSSMTVGTKTCRRGSSGRRVVLVWVGV